MYCTCDENQKPEPIWCPIFDFYIPICYRCKKLTTKEPYDPVKGAYILLYGIRK